MIEAVLHGPGRNANVELLVDSGAEFSMLNAATVDQLGLEQHKEKKVTFVMANGDKETSEFVVEASVRRGDKEWKEKFYVAPIAGFDGVLGMTWLRENNPEIDWRRGTITCDGTTVWTRRGQGGGAERLISFAVWREEACRDGAVTGAISFALEDEQSTMPTGSSADMVRMRSEFADVFPEELPEELPPWRDVNHKIKVLPGQTPPSQPPYRLSEFEERELHKQIADLLRRGLIEPSTSPYAAPVLFVRKADGKLRLCCDYRRLNAITERDPYPLPLPQRLIDKLTGAKFFTKLDLRSGYHQMRVEDEDVHKTAFVTPAGLLQWRVLPFGLTNGPASFQRLMDSLFAKQSGVFLVVYLDDLLIYSRTWTEHLRHVREVLTVLRENKLYAHGGKCVFGVQEVDYVGLRVGKDKVQMAPSKVEAVRAWPRPQTATQLRTFLGLANFYRHLIRNYSELTAPLTHALRGTPAPRLAWTAKLERAFSELKEAVSAQPVVRTADMHQPFVVETDASSTAIGAVLSQGDRPVMFASKVLSEEEQRWSARDRELLAVKHALKNFRFYLHGRRFKLITDHESLQFFQSQKHLEGKLARFADFFAEFDFEIQYRPGRQNGVADALSRRPVAAEETSATATAAPVTVTPRSTQGWLELLRRDRDFANIIATLEKTIEHPSPALQRAAERYVLRNGELIFKDGGRRCVPFGVGDNRPRRDLLADHHDAPLAGHKGETYTLELLQRRFYWPRMRRDVVRYVRSCEVCLASKAWSGKTPGLLQPIEVPTQRWESVGMDFVGPLRATRRGNDMILVIIDRLTRRVRLAAMSQRATAQEVAQMFFDEVVTSFGVPSSIVSDRDPRFTSEFWRDFTKDLQIKLRMSTVAHPQTDGATERANKVVVETLRALTNFDQGDWDLQLRAVEFSINNTVCAATGMTPFQADIGRDPVFPGSVLDETRPPEAHTEFKRKMTETLKSCRDAALRAQESMKERADQHRRQVQVKVGDMVMVDTTVVRDDQEQARESAKLRKRAVGPYKVIGMKGPNAVELQLPRGNKAHSVVNVGRLRKLEQVESELRRAAEKPGPLSDLGEDVFQVERLLAVRTRHKNKEYLVKWKGYEPKDNTWVEASNILDKDMIKKFEAEREEERKQAAQAKKHATTRRTGAGKS